MRILHFHPKNRPLIAQYVHTLCEQMGINVIQKTTTSADEAKSWLSEQHFDILALHGCWQTAMPLVARKARQKGTRIVYTPHGELEPWVMEQQYLKEKLPKQLIYQQRLIRMSYAVVVQGQMEKENFGKLHWNSRTEIIRNSLITNTISNAEMARQVYAVYQKVMDSDVLELMNDEMRSTLKLLIKVGITGDRRWIKDENIPTMDQLQWRMLLNYAHQSQIQPTIERSIRTLQLNVPPIDTDKISYYMADNYQPAESIQHAIGSQFVSENERLLATFRHIRRLAAHNQLAISHIVELDRELREHSAEEDKLTRELKDKKLLTFARNIMQVVQWLTGLEEGLMPVAPLDDKKAKQLRTLINKHLTI